MGEKIVLLIALSLILAACSPTISGTVINQTEPEVCQDVVCGPNEECQEDVCSCQEGFKLCGESCIAEDACCTNDECEESEVCTENKCTFSCDKTACSANKVCDAESERCICPENYLFCKSKIMISSEKSAIGVRALTMFAGSPLLNKQTLILAI